MRRGTGYLIPLSLAFFALLLATALILSGRPGSHDAFAAQGSVDFVSIDMDVNNTPRNGGAESDAQCDNGTDLTGNGADEDLDGVADDGCPDSGIPYLNTVGSIQPCILKNAGTTAAFNYFIDITINLVDPADDLEGWQFDLNFDPTKVNVISIQDSTPLTFMGADRLGNLTSFSAAPGVDGPDPDLIAEGIDGSINLAAVDFADVSNQSGVGILARVTLRNVAVGTSPLALTGLKLNPAGPGNDLCDGKGVDSIGDCFFSGD